MEEKKHGSGVGIIVLVLILLGVGILVYVRLTEVKEEGVSIERIQKEEGIAATTERAVRKSFGENVICDGRIDTANRYMLRASIGGVVRKVNVQVGDAVEKDQVLVEFDKTVPQARVDAAKAAFEEAKSNYRRYQTLFEKGGVSQAAVDASRTAYGRSIGSLEVAKSDLAYTEVKSPVGGAVRVEARFVEPGEEKGIGKELVSLVDLAELDVKASVPESAVSFVRTGGTAEYRLEGESAWRSAKITRISPSTAHPNRFFDVYMRVENEQHGGGWLMRPGMYAQVRVAVGGAADSIAVSASAVRRNGGGEQLFLVDRSIPDAPTARRMAVRTGLRLEGYIQILEGEIEEGSEVVSTPRDGLKDGDRLRIAEN